MNFGLPRRSNLVIADGEKGGVGKSFAQRALAHTILARGNDIVGFDADSRNAHLARYYASTIPVHRIYLRDRAGWNKLIDSIATLDHSTDVLLDLPANMGEVLAKEMSRLLLACQRSNRVVHRMWVMDSEYDSVAQLSSSQDVIPLERTIVVKNGLFGEPEDFRIWEGSKIQAALKAAEGVELHLPAMPPALRSRISTAQCSFSDAANLPLTVSEKLDLEWWLSFSEAAFEPFLEKVGF
ncbi:hypothetical protein [Sphingomonas sp. LY160]|uniref:hypothetical protein n=1 Tax=Sphingomonas sp. LY160 TaxID=3095342 RepID=UPI002ADED2F4|nr:hypothetical protein [Sphingomonas sp. LY160]MEA1071758.1 hypothetical protein [Sphingomonas sp. LY160]